MAWACYVGRAVNGRQSRPRPFTCHRPVFVTRLFLTALRFPGTSSTRVSPMMTWSRTGTPSSFPASTSLPRHLPVLRAGRRVTRRMVMKQNHRRRGGEQRPFEHLPRVDEAPVQSPDCDPVEAEQFVFRVEMQADEIFLALPGEVPEQFVYLCGRRVVMRGQVVGRALPNDLSGVDGPQQAQADRPVAVRLVGYRHFFFLPGAFSGFSSASTGRPAIFWYSSRT